MRKRVKQWLTPQFLAGMAFNNASPGHVHAMAHQLGGFYNLPHGVCNAVLLPHVQVFNSKVAAARLRDCAAAMGVNVTGKPMREVLKPASAPSVNWRRKWISRQAYAT